MGKDITKGYTKQYKITKYTKWRTKIQNKNQVYKEYYNIRQAIIKYNREANNDKVTYYTEPTYSYINVNQ
jgi:hypothetical protein